MSSSMSEIESFVYTGMEALPSNVTRIRVDPSVTAIPSHAFSHCRSLEEVYLNHGLRRIGEYAFYFCALRRIVIPSAVESIGEGAFSHCRELVEVKILSEKIPAIPKYTFRGCRSLKRINIPASTKSIGYHALRATKVPLDLPDGIVAIDDAAFNECKFRQLRVPLSVSFIEHRVFYSCRRMFSLELSEGLDEMIGRHAFANCISLRNIAIPPHAILVGCFNGCEDLLKVFGSTDAVNDALRKRFRGLPIHKICYYQTYHSAEEIIKQVEKAMPESAVDVDCLGMTPLHILACSKRQRLELHQFLISRCPTHLVIRDKWGCLPIFYSCLSGAPSEVLKLLLDSHEAAFPDDVIDAKNMISDLCNHGAPLDTIKHLLGVQRKILPVERVDWDQFASDLSASDAIPRVPIEIFQFVVRFSISKRVHRIGIKQWRLDFKAETESIPNLDRANSLEEIRCKLSDTEKSFLKLKEATSVLELALWKAKVDGLNTACNNVEEERPKKRAKMDIAGFRDQCRISCGAEAVIKSVLPYLIGTMNQAVAYERLLNQRSRM